MIRNQNISENVPIALITLYQHYHFYFRSYCTFIISCCYTRISFVSISNQFVLYLHFSFQIIKMMITVVVIYAICWLPLNIINFTGAIDNSIYNITGMNYIWMASHWLAMSNCMYNPFIYCWMNAKFRNGFLRVLNCFTCGLVNCQESMELQSLRRQDTMLTSMNGHSGSTRRFNSSKRSSSTSKRSYCEYTAMKDKENQR